MGRCGSSPMVFWCLAGALTEFMNIFTILHKAMVVTEGRRIARAANKYCNRVGYEIHFCIYSHYPESICYTEEEANVFAIERILPDMDVPKTCQNADILVDRK